MTILVTGGAGYIGSDLIRALREKYSDQTIRILDSMMRERYVSLWDLEGSFEFIEGDITNEDDIKKSVQDVETVIDLAGITNAPLSFERKELTMDVNLGGVEKLLKASSDAGVKKYIFSSTASVYGTTPGMENEEYDCKPQSPYGESKLLAEAVITKFTKETGFDTTTLRLSTVYGWSIGMRFDTVVDRFTYLAAVGMPLTVWESAWKEMRPYIHVKDVSRGLMFPIGKSMSGIYNVLGQNAALGDVIETIKKFIPSAKVTTVPSTKSQASYMLDDTKIKQLGFEPKLNIEDGVKEIRDKFSAFIK